MSQVKTLGQGAFAIVELGKHIKLQKQVAIKKISKKKITIQNNRNRCLKEISILQNLKHPNIIKIFDVIEHDDFIYLIMEYASEGDLYSAIQKKGKMNEQEARLIFRQIIFGLEYAHQKGVSHRDIKLENILLSKSNKVKIADFGLSSYMKTGQFMSSFRGTIRYADPEILKKKDYSAEVADIWACGIVLYCLICGNLPFEDDILGQLFKKVVMCDYTLPEDISPSVKNLIQGILNCNINQRLSLTEIKNHPWFVDENIIYGLQLNFLNKASINILKIKEIRDDIIQDMLQKNYIFNGCSNIEDIKTAIQNSNSKNQRSFLTDYEIMISSYKQNHGHNLENQKIKNFFISILYESIRKELNSNNLILSQNYQKYFQFRESKFVKYYFGFVSHKTLKETVLILTKVMNQLNIKVLIDKKEGFYFDCEIIQNNISTGKKF